jgi:hypothetical protein
MTPKLRAAVAAIAISHDRRKPVASLFDHGSRQHLMLTAGVEGDRVTSSDHSRTWRLSGALPSLFHSGLDAHIHLAPKPGGEYEGHDHGTDTSFRVVVSGAVAQVYDYRAKAWFSYTAELHVPAF